MSGSRVRIAALAASAAVGLGACSVGDDGDNLVNGKTLFVSKCAGCHTLARANAQGITGPNLDEAWQRADQDGLQRSTFRGLVHRQILQPNTQRQVDPTTGKPLAAMPANLVKGEDARDVAAYVAAVAARRGKDTGRLAEAGKAKTKGTAKAKGGTLDIPVATGLAYQYTAAEAPAGQVTIESKNDESIGHNIAVEGNGVDEKGQVVQGGGVSKVQVTLKPGAYTFYCSVPGHREGGMEGKLTVK